MRRVCFVWAVVLSAAPVLLAGTVTLKASSADVQPGGNAAVAIEVAGGEGIGAMHVELSYDAGVLAVEGVEEGAALDGAMLKANHDTPGRVILSIATAKSVKGTGVLATVRFKVVGGAGAETALTFEKCKAWTDDESEMSLPLETVAGRVRVAGGTPTTAPGGASPASTDRPAGTLPWLPIGIGAAALAIVLLVVAMRGKKAAVVCAKCGATLQGDTRFCAKCGAPRS